MPDMKMHMPNLARHEGVWDGVYRYYDANGDKVDEHRSRLVCRITGDEQVPYHQTNHTAGQTARPRSATSRPPIPSAGSSSTTC